jgi:hypothetical protein
MVMFCEVLEEGGELTHYWGCDGWMAIRFMTIIRGYENDLKCNVWDRRK